MTNECDCDLCKLGRKIVAIIDGEKPSRALGALIHIIGANVDMLMEEHNIDRNEACQIIMVRMAEAIGMPVMVAQQGGSDESGQLH